MPVLDALGSPPPEASVTAALQALEAGRVVALPTDTVYGLGVDPFRPGASDRLFAIKRRPRTVDLPLLVAGADQVLTVATAVPPIAARLMGRYWPGPLTLVLPRRPDLAADLGDDEATVGVRCPDHEVPLMLCRRRGPLVTTSANLHGQPTLTTAAEVEAALGEALAVVLDGGPCAGEPSTVVDCTGEAPKCLREGRIPWTEIQSALA
ncbi:MAG: threonylcarbamoyl-AMP synthase [Actinobacteria bacterium]|nr:MAG: threonylcarbamoyl-AMP synthase [Actinomycetota bacterium]